MEAVDCSSAHPLRIKAHRLLMGHHQSQRLVALAWLLGLSPPLPTGRGRALISAWTHVLVPYRPVPILRRRRKPAAETAAGGGRGGEEQQTDSRSQRNQHARGTDAGCVVAGDFPYRAMGHCLEHLLLCSAEGCCCCCKVPLVSGGNALVAYEAVRAAREHRVDARRAEQRPQLPLVLLDGRPRVVLPADHEERRHEGPPVRLPAGHCHVLRPQARGHHLRRRSTATAKAQE